MGNIARKLYQRVTNFGLAFMLAVSSLAVMGPLLAANNALAAEYPLSVNVVCVDERAVLSVSLRDDIPQLQWATILYSSSYGGASHNLTPGEVDVWSSNSNAIEISGGTVNATVAGIKNVTETGTFWGIPYSIDVPTPFAEEYSVAYPAVNCDATAPTAPVALSPNGWSKFQNVTFSWQASTDNHTGAVTYEVITAKHPNLDSNGKLQHNLATLGTTTATTLAVTMADGPYFWQVQATDSNGNKSAWSNVRSLNVDSKAPVISSNITDEQYLKGNVNVVETVLESNPKAFQFYLHNEDGSVATINGTNVGAYASGTATNSGQLALNINTTKLTDGRYFFTFSATDIIGNPVAPLKVWVTIDNKKPVSKITTPAEGDVVSSDTLAIEGTADDENFSFYRYYVVDESNKRVTPDVLKYSAVVDGVLGDPIDISGLPDGNYQVRLSTADRANNWIADYAAFTIDRSPVVDGDYFVADANGLNVGFTVDRFTDAESVTVGLYDEDDNLIVENLGDSSDMLALLNANALTEISSPFYIPVVSTDDGYWQFGDVDWRNVNKPAYAIVTVVYGDGTAISDPILLGASELGFTYEDHIAGLPDVDDGDDNSGNGGDDNTGGTGGDSAAGLTPPDAFFEDEEGDVNGVQDDNTADQDVAAAQDDNTGDNENNGTVFGLAWYWWLVILAAIAAAWWLIAGALRRRNNEEA